MGRAHWKQTPIVIQARVLYLKTVAGWRIREIALEVGLSHGRVERIVKRGVVDSQLATNYQFKQTPLKGLKPKENEKCKS